MPTCAPPYRPCSTGRPIPRSPPMAGASTWWTWLTGGCCCACRAAARAARPRRQHCATEWSVWSAPLSRIVRIVDVTDHDAGLTPYYSHDSAAPASHWRARCPRASSRSRTGATLSTAPISRAGSGSTWRHCASRCTPAGFAAARNAANGRTPSACGLPSVMATVRGARSSRPDGRVIEVPAPLDTAPTDLERDAALVAGVRTFLEGLPRPTRPRLATPRSPTRSTCRHRTA